MVYFDNKHLRSNVLYHAGLVIMEGEKNPEDGTIYRFKNETFEPFAPLGANLKKVKNEKEIQSAFFRNESVLMTN